MLIIDGNSIYEFDCECAGRKGLYRHPSAAKDPPVRSDPGARCIERSAYTGLGITVAALDTGIFPHPDFQGRIVAWYDAVSHRPEPWDWNGHGTQEGVTSADALFKRKRHIPALICVYTN